MNLRRTCCSFSIYNKDKQSRMSPRFLGFLEMFSVYRMCVCLSCPCNARNFRVYVCINMCVRGLVCAIK